MRNWSRFGCTSLREKVVGSHWLNGVEGEEIGAAIRNRKRCACDLVARILNVYQVPVSGRRARIHVIPCCP